LQERKQVGGIDDAVAVHITGCAVGVRTRLGGTGVEKCRHQDGDVPTVNDPVTVDVTKENCRRRPNENEAQDSDGHGTASGAHKLSHILRCQKNRVTMPTGLLAVNTDGLYGPCQRRPAGVKDSR
jgi:hypothetical protein